jgi:hypothetical protein
VIDLNAKMTTHDSAVPEDNLIIFARSPRLSLERQQLLDIFLMKNLFSDVKSIFNGNAMHCLKIEDEFKSLLPPLSDEEYMSLEADIVSSGKILHPILVWNGIIVDGHNRYEIAQTHEIEFEIKEMPFQDRDEAKIWIIKHQMGRRNLNDFRRAEMALKLKGTIEIRAKANQRAGGGAVPMKSTEPVNTREEIASIASVSEDAIRKVEKIIEAAHEDDIQKLRSGESSINSAFKKIQNCTNSQTDHPVENRSKVQGVLFKIRRLTEQLFKMKNELTDVEREVICGVVQQLSDLSSCDTVAS